MLLPAAHGARAEKEVVLADLQRQAKLAGQRDAAVSKQQKALEAQVSTVCGRHRVTCAWAAEARMHTCTG
jgi:hypothetical protein